MSLDPSVGEVKASATGIDPQRSVAFRWCAHKASKAGITRHYRAPQLPEPVGGPQGLLLQGPPDGDCRAAQIRWRGAAVDCSAAVAAASKIGPKVLDFNFFWGKKNEIGRLLDFLKK